MLLRKVNKCKRIECDGYERRYILVVWRHFSTSVCTVYYQFDSKEWEMVFDDYDYDYDYDS